MEKKLHPYDIEINTLGFFVDRLLYAMIKSQNEDLKANNLDIQHAEFIVMKVINVLGEASQSQLANVMGKERSGISRTLASLEKKGYVERKPVNGSTNSVTLTEKGKNLIPMILRQSERLTERTLKGFSPKKKEKFLAYLEQAYHNVKSND